MPRCLNCRRLGLLCSAALLAAGAAPARAARDLRAPATAGSGTGLPECEPQMISFENKCRFPLELAINGLLGNDDGLARGFCIEGVQPAGAWCTRAWFKLEPGGPNGQARLIMSKNRHVYFYAKAQNEQGTPIEWKGNSSAGLWLDLPDTAPSGAKCTQGSTPSCRPMIEVRVPAVRQTAASRPVQTADSMHTALPLCCRVLQGDRRSSRDAPSSPVHAVDRQRRSVHTVCALPHL